MFINPNPTKIWITITITTVTTTTTTTTAPSSSSSSSSPPTITAMITKTTKFDSNSLLNETFNDYNDYISKFNF
ncbi:unnamed protein product [Cercopithifilaria johnstoni]|uniref:Uncharacterized protein n=1 Tax=Cercopithifilaria johnstoni TaxID=2874296 RepID=A0A8J2Q3U5_9BILA|nr:unnamed protein product [Cercopithifilaria johnstoni]